MKDERRTTEVLKTVLQVAGLVALTAGGFVWAGSVNKALEPIDTMQSDINEIMVEMSSINVKLEYLSNNPRVYAISERNQP